MIGLFVWGAVYLARTVEYAVQAGRSLIVSFVGLLPLAGLGAAESGVNCGVIGVIAVASAFVSIALELFLASEGLVSLAVLLLRASQLSSPAQKGGHECREGCHGLRLLLTEVAC